MRHFQVVLEVWKHGAPLTDVRCKRFIVAAVSENDAILTVQENAAARGEQCGYVYAAEEMKGAQ